MAYSLNRLGRNYRDTATAGFRDMAGQEAQREQANEGIKAAEKQQKASMAGSGAGIGAMAGMKFGAGAGLAGAVIGLGAGLLLSEIF